MRIDELTPESRFSDVVAAVKFVAGMPESIQETLLKEIAERCKRLQASFMHIFHLEKKRRARTKHARLMMKDAVVEAGLPHVVDGGAVIMDDPLRPGETIRVVNSALLGYNPIVAKTTGYAHHVDEYVAAFFGANDLTAYVIPDKDVLALADVLNDCDTAKHYPAELLASPNVQAFEEVLRDAKYERLLITLKMNQRFAIVENSGPPVIINTSNGTFHKEHDFVALHRPEKDLVTTGDHKRKVSRTNIWLDHAARAQYSKIVFAPRGHDRHGRPISEGNSYNLWKEYRELGAPADWSLLDDHLKTIICNGNEEAYDYLLNWIAQLFQFPWIKPGVAIVVWGQKRTGKGTVADAIRDAVGPMLSRVFIQKEHVIGRFAASATPLMFNQIEEALFAKDPREEGPLKSKISDPDELLELKFQTPYEVASFGRWWFNSNSPAPVPITYDEERYFVLHVNPGRANDHAYFAAIRQQLYHQGGLAGFVHDMMSRDIVGFNVRSVPRTAARSDMVVEMLSHEDRAVLELLQAGEVSIYDASEDAFSFQEILNEHTHTWVDKQKVRTVLNHAFKRYGAKDATQADINKTLSELGVIDGQRNRHEQRNQEAGYRFVALSQARQNFADARGLPLSAIVDQGDGVTHEDALVDLAAELDRAIQKYTACANPPCNASELEQAAVGFRSAAEKACSEAKQLEKGVP